MILNIKKAILFGFLSTLLLVEAFAFSDVTDIKTKTAVDTLHSLGIVNGKTSTTFDPNGTVTRAEFTKMAVVALGEDDISTKQNYTIFPDVLHTHWASSYINAALEIELIRGFPDNTFRPENTINYSEAITIMLYMLDYKIEDIGADWPNSYISLAKNLGITDNVVFESKNSVTRADAAIMLSNLLNTSCKDGGIFIEKAFPYTSDDVYILATSQTDSSLSTNQIKVWVSGLEQVITSEISNIVYGAKGTLIYSNSAKQTAIAFLQNGYSESVILQNIYIDKIVSNDNTYYIDAETPLIVDGEVSTYEQHYLAIFPGSSVNLNYDTYGNISSISVNNVYSTSTLSYSSNTILPSYPIYKNGVEIDISDIKEGNIISIIDGVIYVSDKTVTGYYEAGTPSIFYPSSITVLSKSFNVPTSLKSNFSSIGSNSLVTLYLDAFGNLANVVKNDKSSQTVLLNSYDGLTANVTIDGLYTVDISIDESNSATFTSGAKKYSVIYKYISQFVDLKFSSNGKISVSSSDNIKSIDADYDISNNTLGKYEVSPYVSYYEGYDQNTGYISLSKDEIGTNTIPAEYILGAEIQNGKVTKIVFKNLTGNYFDYGITTSYQEEVYSPGLGVFPDSYYNNNYYSLKTSTETKTYNSINYTSLYNIPAAIPKNIDTSSREYKHFVSIYKLEDIGNFSNDNFYGFTYLEKDGKMIDIDKNVLVYNKTTDSFLSLIEARQNYTSFKAYMDNSYLNPSVRIIVVS